MAGVKSRKGMLLKPLPPHGDRRRYLHKVKPCRCAKCSAANTEYMNKYREAKRIAASQATYHCDWPGCGFSADNKMAIGGHKSGHTKRKEGLA